MHLRGEALAEGRLALLHRVKAILCTVNISKRVCLVQSRHMTAGSTHSRVTKSNIDERLLVVIPSEMIHLLALQLVLDTLAIRSVADQRENRPNAFDEKCALVRFSIVQSSLE